MKHQTTFSLRIPEATSREIDKAAKKMGLTRAGVCRLAVSLGLQKMEATGYHLAAAVDHSSRDPAEPPGRDALS